jgi:PAS domain S-box-containing protein
MTRRYPITMTEATNRASLPDMSGPEPERHSAVYEAPAARAGRQGFLLHLNDQLRALDDPLTILERATELLARHLGAARSGYGEIDDAEEHIAVERDWTSPAMASVAGRYRLDDFGPQVIQNLKAGRTLVVADVKDDPRTSAPAIAAAYEAIGTRTVVSVPLIKGGRLTALLFIHHPEPRTWLPEEVALAEDVAERTWSAMERARAETALRRSEERFRLSQEAGGVGLWDWNLKTGELFWSDKIYDLFGVPREAKPTIDDFQNLIHPDDRAAAQAAAETVWAGTPKIQTEFRIVRPADGRVMWVASRGELTCDGDGRPVRLVGVNFDITDRKKAEATLRESAERLQLALTASGLGDWTWDAASDCVTLSDRAAEIFGLPAGMRPTWAALQSVIHPEDVDGARQAFADAVQTGAPFLREYRVRRPSDGAETWVSAQGQPVQEPDGTPRGITGVVSDITERRRGQERQHLLIRELHHRVKNTLATVQAIVGSTARTASSIEEFYDSFVGRIVSLAHTHNLLTEDYWQTASLEELLRNELGPYEDGAKRVSFEGPAVELPSEIAVPIGMAIHELTTNAIKHGALSTSAGRVDVSWEVRGSAEQPLFHFAWTESGGPPVHRPKRQGFGSRLLQRVLTAQAQADVDMHFDEAGLRFTMVMPLPRDTALLNLLS